MADQVKYSNQLHGSKIVIIGGSSGIGFAIAEASLEHGAASVTISSSNSSRISAAAARLFAAYPSAASRVSGHVCNLADEHTIEENIVQLLDAVGPDIDHIVHCAGEPLPRAPLEEVDFESIKQIGMIRFFSYLLLGKHAKKYMRGGRECSISFTTAGVSERPMPGWTVLNAYSTGQHGIVRGLALDLKPIRVNLVLPGAVDTEFWANSGFSEEKKRLFLDGVASKLPAGKVPGPEEIAESYLYLMKDRNVTGTVVSTNGGWFLV